MFCMGLDYWPLYGVSKIAFLTALHKGSLLFGPVILESMLLQDQASQTMEHRDSAATISDRTSSSILASDWPGPWNFLK